MKKIALFSILFATLWLASCSKCYTCTINQDEQTICTNSLLDTSKAKQNCKKANGEWLKLKE